MSRTYPGSSRAGGGRPAVFDVLTRQLIRERYEFRFVTTPDGGVALALEREVQRGALSAGKPFLTPRSCAVG